MGAPFPHFIASFPVNSDMFFTSAYMKLLPPRSAHSYQQDSQSNTAGPLSLQGGTPTGQLQGLAQLLPAHTTFHTGEQAGWTGVTEATTLHSLSPLIRAHPSSIIPAHSSSWATNAGYVKKRGGWRQLDPYPSTWTHEKPTCCTFIVCTSEKVFKVIDCDVIVSSGLLPQPEKSKKMQAK